MHVGLILLDTNQKQNTETGGIDQITAKSWKESLPGSPDVRPYVSDRKLLKLPELQLSLASCRPFCLFLKGEGLNVKQIIHFSKKYFPQAGISTRLSKHFHWLQAAAGHLKWSI